MKHKIKFKCITNEGKTKTITKTLDFPDFANMIDNDNYITVDGRKIYCDSVNIRIMDYLDNMDKSDFMINNNISIILDYCVYEKKTNSNSTSISTINKNNFKEFLFDNKDVFNIDESIILDLYAAYTKFYNNISKLDINKQLLYCLDIVTAGYMGASTALDGLNYSESNKLEHYDENKNTTIIQRTS